MATIRRLVIVREGEDGPAIFQDLLDRFKEHLDANVPMPIQIQPAAWAVTDPPSHVGVVLVGLKLKKLMELKAWEEATKRSTVLEMAGDDSQASTETNVGVALASVGLRVHPLAD
jgi:hypothetical protein